MTQGTRSAISTTIVPGSRRRRLASRTRGCATSLARAAARSRPTRLSPARRPAVASTVGARERPIAADLHGLDAEQPQRGRGARAPSRAPAKPRPRSRGRSPRRAPARHRRAAPPPGACGAAARGGRPPGGRRSPGDNSFSPGASASGQRGEASSRASARMRRDQFVETDPGRRGGLGQQAGRRHARDRVHLDQQRPPALVQPEIDPARAAAAERAVRRERQLPRARGLAGGQRRGDQVLGRPVVVLRRRSRRSRRAAASRPRPGPGRRGRRPSGPVPGRTSRRAPRGRSGRPSASARASAPRVRTTLMPTEEPSQIGLTTTGGSSRSSGQAPARPRGEHLEVRGRQPVRAEDPLALLLVHRQRARQHAGAGVGDAEALEQPLDRAVLAAAPVQRDERHAHLPAGQLPAADPGPASIADRPAAAAGAARRGSPPRCATRPRARRNARP